MKCYISRCRMEQPVSEYENHVKLYHPRAYAKGLRIDPNYWKLYATT